ncbi:MAG TPA: pseudouridine synthase [Bdellovibrionales bacterium]|nr:pseudouridine synthase [Bdellovibrionales bacterium]
MNFQLREETGVAHARVTRNSRLKEFVLGLPLHPIAVDEWLRYGSIYVDGLRVRQDREVRQGQIVRLHTRRKNYVTTELRPRVVFDHEEFLVLDKPAGLPTHPTLDNYIQNAKVQLETELGQPLFVTHRLDITTEGLLILAKAKDAQALINKLFAKGRVEKLYRAEAAKDVAPGPYTHWMNPESRIPKEMSLTAVDGWWECRLEVLAVERGSHRVRLLSGKTHQIRAQFMAVGAPLKGDAIYGSTEPWTGAGLGLFCEELKLRFRNPEFHFRRNPVAGAPPDAPTT